MIERDTVGAVCPRLKPNRHAGYSIKGDNRTGVSVRVGAPVCVYRGRDRERFCLLIYIKLNIHAGFSRGQSCPTVSLFVPLNDF